MYNHPELGRRLAQAKLEEARSRMQRAAALRAAALDRQAPTLSAGTRRDRWPLLMLATASRRRARGRSLRANSPWTNG
jgi:hypothetical protein